MLQFWCTDRLLPPLNKEVLIRFDFGYRLGTLVQAHRLVWHSLCDEYQFEDATHWLELPPHELLPKGTYVY